MVGIGTRTRALGRHRRAALVGGYDPDCPGACAPLGASGDNDRECRSVGRRETRPPGPLRSRCCPGSGSPRRPRPSRRRRSWCPEGRGADRCDADAPRVPTGLDSSGVRGLGGGLLPDLRRLAYACRGAGTRRPAPASLRAPNQRTVDVCERCRHYVKAVTVLTPILPEQVFLHDLATLVLDVIALERGYSRPAAEGRSVEVIATPSRLRTLFWLHPWTTGRRP